MQNAALSASDILAVLDAQGGALKAAYAVMGTDAPSETTTLGDKLDDVYTAVNGLSNPDLKAQIANDAKSNALAGRWDIFFYRLSNPLRQMDTYAQSAVSALGWSLNSSTGRALDLWCRRLNGNDPNAPAKPDVSGVTLSATTGGAIPTCAAGSAPRVVLTYVGANDWEESQPSAELAQVALSGANSAYTLAGLPGSVPTGVKQLRVYRGYVGGDAGTYYLDQSVATTPGSAFPTVTLANADSALRSDITPPSWLSCLWMPEAAACYALALATFDGQVMTYGASSLPGADNVVLNPSNAFIGFNATADAVFGTQVVGSAYAAGSPRLTSDYANRLQGFAGATKLQARVTSALNASATLTNVAITYFDAAHPAAAQTTTIAGPFTLTAAEGDTVEITGLPTGALVQSVTGNSVASAASGTFIYEAKAARTI